MSNQMREALLLSVRKMRDEQRPSMELVVDTIDEIFEDFGDEVQYTAASRGPVTWSWVDLSNSALGYEKWFVLTGSTMEGTEGYPLLTIRQSMAPRLDSWLTVSQLIVGSEVRDIKTSLAMAIANHNGAFDGLRESVSTIVEMMSPSIPDNIIPTGETN